MKKTIHLFLLFPLLVMPLSAQITRGLQGNYILDSFPNVSFVWNTGNTEAIDPSQFALYEEGELVEFKVEALPAGEKKGMAKNILILWEDMASHNRQSEFTREVLSRFFNEISIDSTDAFDVAVFDRQKDTEKKVIKPLVGQFTSDRQRLTNAVSSYQCNSRQYPSFSMMTDLYQAIDEGISLLPPDRAGVIVVVTAGLNMKAAGASTDMESIRKHALGANTPIYVIKYPIAGNAPEINILSESTFGLVTSSTTDVNATVGNLKHYYHGFDDRLLGRNYKFTFVSHCERDGKPHPLRLTVDKMRRPLPPFIAPKVTFVQRLVQYWWLTAIIVLAIIGAVVIIILSSQKKEKEREQANRAMHEQYRLQQEESERRNLEAMDALRREQEAKEQAILNASMQEKKAAEEERLFKLMQTKNLFPRLQCQSGNEVFSYTINKPLVTLGRDTDNDVSFANNQTVSSHHAEIIFNGSAFEVFNRSRSYAQGIIVNGQFYQQYTLRSGDIIGLGEAIVTFYT
jgi:type II secretory pathway pseudopilin PulG